MKRAIACLLLAFLAACAEPDAPTELVIQRFFGSCQAEFGELTDPSQAEGECGIMTALINQFEEENPDIRVTENVVFWPGYDQLTSQMAANDPPDLVTMHSSAIADYQARDLLEPLDAYLPEIGIRPADLTNAARAGVTMNEQVMGVPLDVWASLWHINLNLFRQAGLMRDGNPILPTSPDEFFSQARQFQERTGKPYLIQVSAKDYSNPMRTFYALVMQQGAPLFRDARHANFDSPEARRALEFMREIYLGGYSTKDQDYTATVSSFLKGEGGVFLTGTWMVGEFDAAAKEENSPLYGGYTAVPFVQLYHGSEKTLVDGHNWVMPRDARRTPQQREAALRFLKFFAANDFQWSRTGHLPAYKKIIESESWRQLPQRENLAVLSKIGQPLPKNILRQAPIENIVGQEASAAFTGAKSVSDALRDMQRRTNDILQSY